MKSSTSELGRTRRVSHLASVAKPVPCIFLYRKHQFTMPISCIPVKFCPYYCKILKVLVQLPFMIDNHAFQCFRKLLQIEGYFFSREPPTTWCCEWN